MPARFHPHTHCYVSFFELAIKLFRFFRVNQALFTEFSGFRMLPGYDGPRPASDDFMPYGGAVDKLEGGGNPRLAHAFRQGMLLHGVDLPGLSGMTTAAHTEADVEQTLAAAGA